MTPKISIVMPCYNVEKYVEQSIQSALDQTLSDFELICVNDGSTDGTLAVLQRMAAADARIKIIDKPNEGYGVSMNKGFDAARGQFIGILESDDFIDANMLEDHYNAAIENDAQVVKSNFYYYWSKPEERNVFSGLMTEDECGHVFAPLEQEHLFHVKPTIWSAIYRADFIRENNIRFNETPGASYQDASFNFQVWANAERVFLLHAAYLHYRQDNEASSVNSPGKVYCVCDEYAKIEEVIAALPDQNKAAALRDIMVKMKFDSYMWNYDRLSEPLRREFIELFAREFSEYMANGQINESKFEWWNLRDMREITSDPMAFHANRCQPEGGKQASNKLGTAWHILREKGFGEFCRTVKQKLAK